MNSLQEGRKENVISNYNYSKVGVVNEKCYEHN